ncbi:hypothetical protein EDF55_1197 [Curtobacterium sp. ZW137]|nr:hypothetical protein EDF55_1197 [Curtobacterium sp. ZW137]
MCAACVLRVLVRACCVCVRAACVRAARACVRAACCVRAGAVRCVRAGAVREPAHDARDSRRAAALPTVRAARSAPRPAPPCTSGRNAAVHGAGGPGVSPARADAASSGALVRPPARAPGAPGAPSGRNAAVHGAGGPGVSPARVDAESSGVLVRPPARAGGAGGAERAKCRGARGGRPGCFARSSGRALRTPGTTKPRRRDGVGASTRGRAAVRREAAVGQRLSFEGQAAWRTNWTSRLMVTSLPRVKPPASSAAFQFTPNSVRSILVVASAPNLTWP